MEQTPNYALSQWDEQERILREDFNANNAKVEQALAEQAESLAALAAQTGNCEMTFLTYTGTGSYNGTATRIAFPARPDAYIIAGDCALLFGQGSNSKAILSADDAKYSECFVSEQSVTWSENTLLINDSVNARYQMNTSGKPYWVLALHRKNA